ncbi:hypothetical protein D3C78_1500840 [compost metagenome]
MWISMASKPARFTNAAAARYSPMVLRISAAVMAPANGTPENRPYWLMQALGPFGLGMFSGLMRLKKPQCASCAEIAPPSRCTAAARRCRGSKTPSCIHIWSAKVRPSGDTPQ